jgi:Transglycosylase SLT domain
MAISPFVPGALSYNGARASPEVASAIQKASASTGVDFAYLVAQAGQESSFQPDAKAGTSSARGLYQFVNSTWLKLVHDKGAAHGLGEYASQIDMTDSGPKVADPIVRHQILALREDPTIAAAMAAEYAKANGAQLQQDLGRAVSSTDLYMAHFLGTGGASKFLSALDTTPNTTGAALLPDAAAANRGVFYNSDGSPRTVAQIYNHFASRFGDTARQIAQGGSNSIAPSLSPFSPAAITRAAIFQALAGQELSSVTIQALLQLKVPEALQHQANHAKST